MIKAENIVRVRVSYIAAFQELNCIIRYISFLRSNIRLSFDYSYLSFTFSDDMDNIGGGCNMVWFDVIFTTHGVPIAISEKINYKFEYYTFVVM